MVGRRDIKASSLYENIWIEILNKSAELLSDKTVVFDAIIRFIVFLVILVY